MTEGVELINRSNTICHYTRFRDFWILTAMATTSMILKWPNYYFCLRKMG
jgi:hypothetical protein